ncbi:unnamed protein product [Aphanomyces euteiches]|uniref:Uncharacterized protein n=1 Tax=Aphanomyces euteiches TaxID=100861 RepID=A0A6G0XFQ6_9STRA|nr:hypothetical protein Ae201684_005286 [Aphanomyces euteiches]KAH9053419.1 hypothetical protein Ae201684P_015188 [Aphanomyces euteiches]KAH9144972.1 hypothetical protein AeRB84_011110 [Aphanomyces euteiches]
MAQLPGPVFQVNVHFEGNDHSISLYDAEPGGLVAIVVNTGTNAKYIRAFSTANLRATQVTKTKPDYYRLAESLYLAPAGGTHELQIHSSLRGMSQPEAIATAEAAHHYLTNASSGPEKFTQVLSRGLVMLCKDKPMGLQAVTRLGKWLVENNPNRPKVVLPA